MRCNSRPNMVENILKEHFIKKDQNKILELSDFKKENMKVSFGKKKHFLFKIT